MQKIRPYLLALALLLAGCSQSIFAQRPTATPTNIPAAANAVAPTTTQNPTIEAAPTEDEVPATATESQSASAEATTNTTVAVATIAPTPVAVAAAPAEVAPALAQEQPFENLNSPVDLLASYYNAITLGDYERAYSYWQNAPLDYESFAGGYADTASVQVIVQPPTLYDGAAGSLYVGIPSFLIARHTDGSVHSFAGCIVARKSNLHPPDIPEEDVWHLYQAQLEEVANNAAIPAALAQACAS